MKLSRHGRDLTRVELFTTRKLGVVATVKFFEGLALAFAGAGTSTRAFNASSFLRKDAGKALFKKDQILPKPERTIATTNHQVHTHKIDFKQRDNVDLEDIVRAEMWRIFDEFDEYRCQYR